MALSINDSVSHANSEDYITEHVDFFWNVDFEKEKIDGSVLLRLKNITKHFANLKLDCRHLNIIEVLVQGTRVDFELIQDTIDALGNCLSIPIITNDDYLKVEVTYSTTAGGSALQWLRPEATKGKKHPYMFSQCQAILARSLFPCQDTPSVKFTYYAQVNAVSHLNVLMSAVKSDIVLDKGTTNLHTFEQKIPIPSYLVAIVCGNLEGRKIGPRSTVWSEPEMVDDAAREFEDTEQFLLTGEELCGPYVWGVYDLLVLPPSFPYGGMENPCLTFVTPTLLVGDKSLVYVIAHEISHSWTGNLVTNKTWDDFWLNEGHTMYLEYLIMERYYRDEEMRHLLITMGLASLKESLTFLGRDNPFNQMVPDLKGCDPDDAWSFVPYEKGQNLLFHLESICGKDKMLRWLREYLKKFKNMSITTEQWREFLYEYMTGTEQIDHSLLDGVDWSEWFRGRGDLPVQPWRLNHFADDSRNLADKWRRFPNIKHKQELRSDYVSMLPLQRYYMFQILNDEWETKLLKETLACMCQAYQLTESTNSEILAGWSLLCIRAMYMPAIDQIFTFLNSQGRLRFNRPIYKALYNWESMRQRTIDNFIMMRPQLHPTTVKAISHILHLAH